MTALLLSQVEEWRVHWAGSLNICSIQMEFAKSPLGSKVRCRSPKQHSLHGVARTAAPRHALCVFFRGATVLQIAIKAAYNVHLLIKRR